MADIQSATAEIGRGKEEEERKKPQEYNIIAWSLLWAAMEYTLS